MPILSDDTNCTASASQPSRKLSDARAPVITQGTTYNHGCQTGCRTGARTVQAEAFHSEDTHHKYINMTSTKQSTHLNGDQDLQPGQASKGNHYQGVSSEDTSTQVNGNNGFKALEAILNSGAQRRGGN